MEETWTSRDLPVLRAIVEVFERTGRVMHPNEIVQQSGLTGDQVERALNALEGEIRRSSPNLIGALQEGSA